jgi:hypothetical protein
VGEFALSAEHVDRELPAELLGNTNELAPAIEVEIGLVAKVGVDTADTIVNLERAVLGDAKGRAQGVGNARVRSADRSLARGQITTGDQPKPRQERACVVAKAQG